MNEAPNKEYTVEEALALLPEGDMVHTFLNPAGMLLGADWSRADVEEAIRDSTKRLEAGPSAAAVKHSLVIFEKEGRMVFIATKEKT